MHRMSEMQIQYRLKSVTLMKQESLLMRHTVLLYSLQHGFVSNLKEDQIIRHYDVTGKNCPKYFVENEDAWEMFKDNVWDAVQKK